MQTGKAGKADKAGKRRAVGAGALERRVARRRRDGVAADKLAEAIALVGRQWIALALAEEVPFGGSCVERADRDRARREALLTLAAAGGSQVRRALVAAGEEEGRAALRSPGCEASGPRGVAKAARALSVAAIADVVAQSAGPRAFERTCLERRTLATTADQAQAWLVLAAAGGRRVCLQLGLELPERWRTPRRRRPRPRERGLPGGVASFGEAAPRSELAEQLAPIAARIYA